MKTTSFPFDRFALRPSATTTWAMQKDLCPIKQRTLERWENEGGKISDTPTARAKNHHSRLTVCQSG